jgi:hypothetical protein
MGVFLFELPEGAVKGKPGPVSVVQLGMPKPTLKAWNLDMIVQLVCCMDEEICDVAIRDVKAKMHFAVEGEQGHG